MILIINICKEKLHAHEFVKPIEKILNRNKFKFLTKHYNKITKKDLDKADKVIICGTSLRDNEFFRDINKFSWIKDFGKPVFGICGGAHIIGTILGHTKKLRKEIGLKNISIKKEFLGVKGNLEVYHLHQFSVLPEVFHEKNLYATLFHPEVRNENMIASFLEQ